MSNPFDALDDVEQDVLQAAPAPGLSERFLLNMEAGQRMNTVLGATRDAMPAHQDDRQRFDARYEAFPEWQGFMEGATALAGQLVGTAASPENFLPIGLGHKILVGTKMGVTGLWAKVFAGAVDGAAANAVADLAIQGLENVGGHREGFDPVQYGAGVLLGTGIGGAGGAVARGVEVVGEVGDAVRATEGLQREATERAARGDAAPANPFDQLDDVPAVPPAALEPAAAPASAGRAVKPAAADAPESVDAPPPAAPSAEPSQPAALPAEQPPAPQSSTIGETLSDRAATSRGVTPQERRILAQETPIGDRPRKPVNLIRFLANEGGIADHGGELRSLDLHNHFVPGAGRLVQDRGRSLDYAREAAAEAGYFDHIYGDRDSATAQSTVADLLELLDQDARGNRVYSSADTDAAATATAHEEAVAARAELRGRLDRVTAEIETELPDEIVIRATELLGDGMEAPDAIEMAILEDYRANGSPIPLERADGSEYDIPFFDEPGGLPAQRGQDARGAAGGDAGAEGDARADGPAARGAGADQARPASERTDAGEQTLLGGVAPVSDADRLRARAAKPMRGGDKAAGGLFDETARNQKDIGDFLKVAPRLAGSLRGERARPQAGIAKAAQTAVTAIERVRETAEALASALDVAGTRQGRLPRLKGVQGVYKYSSGTVRVRSLDDFDVISHEYGHHVEKRMPGITALMKAHAAELAKLDYDPLAARPEEGFAEFFRLWLTNRAYARKAAPTFARIFEAELMKRPELREPVDAATEAWSAFLSAPSSVAVASTIVSGRRKGVVGRSREALKKYGLGDTIHDVLQKAYTFLLDDLNPLARAVDELKAVHHANTGKVLDLPVGRDAYKLARMSRGAYAQGHMDVMYGVASYRGLNPESPSLRDAIVEATGKPNALSGWDDARAQEFASYLWSRRALGEWARFEAGEIPNPPDKLTKGDHETNVSELAAANPQFVSAAAKVHAFSHALWKKKFDAGLIDEVTYEDGLKIVDYVPGLRDWESSDTDAKVPGGRNKGRSAKGGFARRFRGSKRDVINPLESLAADAYETAMAISRNDVVKALDRLAMTAGPGGGAIAERIPVRELQATMVDPLEAVETAARNAGLAKPDRVMLRDAVESAIGDEKAAIFRPAIINDKGEPIVFFRDGGQLTALRLADGAFGKDIYRTLTAMNQVERNLWLELIAIPARVLRLGITTAFEFIGANFIRDQAMAMIYFGRPLRRLGASLQGVGDDLLGSDTAKAYSRVAGISGGQEVASLSQARVERDITGLKRKGWAAQRLTSARGILQIAEFAETSTRLGLFRTFVDEARARGLDDMEAALEASWRARDYIDFDRRGSGMAALARIIPFFNVSLQGLDKSYRHMLRPLAAKMLGQPMEGEGGRELALAVKSWARLGALVAASMSLYALQSRHEDQDEISETTRATHWMVKSGEKWWAIPKPFEFASVINLAEAAFDAMAKQDPSALGRWVDSLHHTLMPPSIAEGNPAVASYFEVKTNTNFFTGAPIVPEHLQGMEPFLQYTERTSHFSRQLGEWFDIPPAIADHLITAHLGSWGRSLLSLYDLAQPDAPGFAWDDAPIARRFIKDAAKGAQSTSAFWELAGEREGVLEGKYASWRSFAENGDAAGAADYYARQDEISKAYIGLAGAEAKTRRLHPMVRARGGIQAIGKIRRDLAAGRLETAMGEPVELSAAARTAADDVLSTLSMAMARNALMLTGVPGWAQRSPIDEAGFYRELEALSPALLQRLGDGFTTNRVWSYDAVAEAWPDLRARILEEGSGAPVLDLVARVEAQGPAVQGFRIKRKERPGLTLP